MPNQRDNTAAGDSRADTPFPATRWSMVLMARHEDRVVAERALEELCRQYWYPLYAWLRRRGYSRSDAEDLTQSFFARILADDALHFARQEKGRLRTFLLTALQRHVADDARYQGAARRGGEAVRLSIDADHAEHAYAAELTDGADPERLYLKAWARTVMDGANRRLGESYEESGRGKLFESFSEFLGWNEGDTPYREVAARLDMTEPAVRLQVFRLRNRYRKFLEEEIAQTVSTPEELKAELEFLMKVVRD